MKPMTSGAPDRRSLFRIIVGVGAGLVFPTCVYAQSGERVGSVEEVKGEAFAQAGTQQRTLDRMAPLYINDVVATGADARLAMRLGADTTLRMGQLARLTIDRFLVNAGGEITLQSGPVLFDRPAAARPVPMRINSAFGLIAVRGTRFFAGPSAGVFGIFVDRGSVSVSAAGTQVVVQAGQGTNIARPGDPPTPPAPWGAGRISSAMQSVE
jgi:ferric-dicitrate binding protein FerR (iron transport regulator)